MHPDEFHLDFEKPLSQALSATFPSATILKDFFHFIQANVKKAKGLNMKPLMRNLVKDLNTLWYQPTKANFDTYLNEFLGKWERLTMYYTTYF